MSVATFSRQDGWNQPFAIGFFCFTNRHPMGQVQQGGFAETQARKVFPQALDFCIETRCSQQLRLLAIFPTDIICNAFQAGVASAIQCITFCWRLRRSRQGDQAKRLLLGEEPFHVSYCKPYSSLRRVPSTISVVAGSKPLSKSKVFTSVSYIAAMFSKVSPTVTTCTGASWDSGFSPR